MAIKQRTYTMDDLVEQDLKTAPTLDLPAFKTEKVYVPKDGGNLIVFFANVKKDWRPADGCPYCDNKELFTLSGRNNPRRIKDISRNNKCIQIITQSPRMTCNKCEQRFTPKIDGIMEEGTMTERLVEFIKVESFLQPFTVIQERTGVSVTTIANIMNREIERIESERAKNPLVAPTVLGIDEKHIVHDMRGTLVDIENGNLLDILEGNSQKEFRDAIMKLKDWDKNIKVVTTDMNNSYLHWMPDFLSNATFVIDKFHVFQDVNNKVKLAKTALYEYRKNLIKGMVDKEEKAKAKETLKLISENNRLFNYSSYNLESGNGEKALKLATVVDAFPEFALLRRIYTTIEEMYVQSTREDAEKIWDEWQELLPPPTKDEYKKWCKKHNVDAKCFEAFKSLRRVGFIQYKPYILNYFNPGCRFTNATTEGLNNLIGTINSSGNGYQFKHLRAKCLYASLIHERIMYSIDINTIESWKPTNFYQTNPFVYSKDEIEYVDKMVLKDNVEKVNITPNSILNNSNIVKQMLQPDEIISIPKFDYQEEPTEEPPKSLKDFLNQYT